MTETTQKTTASVSQLYEVSAQNIDFPVYLIQIYLINYLSKAQLECAIWWLNIEFVQDYHRFVYIYLLKIYIYCLIHFLNLIRIYLISYSSDFSSEKNKMYLKNYIIFI